MAEVEIGNAPIETPGEASLLYGQQGSDIDAPVRRYPVTQLVTQAAFTAALGDMETAVASLQAIADSIAAGGD